VTRPRLGRAYLLSLARWGQRLCNRDFLSFRRLLCAVVGGGVLFVAIPSAAPGHSRWSGGFSSAFPKVDWNARHFSERVLYAFPYPSLGEFPLGPVVEDAEESLYGTTSSGGSATCNNDCGLVFKLTNGPSGYAEVVLHDFEGVPDGLGPVGTLILDNGGAVYGATAGGGTVEQNFPGGAGTIYKLAPFGSGYSVEILHAFKYGRDGARPQAGLIADATGALYGTTLYGGDPGCTERCGTVFKLSPAGSGYKEAVIHRFKADGIDGVWPLSNLIIDSRGNLFGSTIYGGDGPHSACGSGCGTVYELVPTSHGYVERVIYSFQGGADGKEPLASLALDRRGDLFGAASSGGSNSKACDPLCGTVFRLSPSGSTYRFTLLYQFLGGSDGSYPVAGLLIGGGGTLFGTTARGGNGCFGNQCGTVFELVKSGSTYRERLVHVFTGEPDGAEPETSLTTSTRGNLIGTTYGGGSLSWGGTVFSVRD